MLVCGQDFTEEIIGKIREIVTANPGISRRDLSLRVCGWLNWKSPNGRFQEMSCRVALLKLERRGIVKLPQAHLWGCNRAKRKGHSSSIREISPICCNLKELGGVDL